MRQGTRILRLAIKKAARTQEPIITTVVGFPKTGKSSVINVLKGRHSAMTSAIPGTPGYTRHMQLFKIEPGFYMYDTPGVIPVEGGPLESVIRGASPEEIKEPIEPATKLLELALKHNPSSVVDAYGIKTSDPYSILVELAKKRGWVYKRDKEPIVEEAARAVIRDYHRAKLRFYVTPESIGLDV
jgi:ribosome biogenesis GTPase A